MMNPKKKPKFRRWLSQRFVRLKTGWRRPKGMHSKIRIRERAKIVMPIIGFGAPRALRGLHPSGFREVMVHNVNDLKKIDAKKDAARISHGVSERKRQEIAKQAAELKIKVLNP